MRPLLHAHLVNDRFGDPVVYVETLFERHAVLLDLGDISALPPRKANRIEQVFVSHAHIDHFFGFDFLLRMLVGREKTVQIFGPEGFIERVHHKLQAYQWNLVDSFICDLIFNVSEINAFGLVHSARFRLKTAFTKEELEVTPPPGEFILILPQKRAGRGVAPNFPGLARTRRDRSRRRRCNDRWHRAPTT